MTSMDALLAADPDFRVIHLLRDPRGVVASRRATGDDSMIGRYVMSLCQSFNGATFVFSTALGHSCL